MKRLNNWAVYYVVLPSSFQDPQMYLVSLCSLTLAAKMEESERRIPRASSLRPLVGDAFTCSDFLQAFLCDVRPLIWALWGAYTYSRAYVTV